MTKQELITKINNIAAYYSDTITYKPNPPVIAEQLILLLDSMYRADEDISADELRRFKQYVLDNIEVMGVLPESAAECEEWFSVFPEAYMRMEMAYMTADHRGKTFSWLVREAAKLEAEDIVIEILNKLIFEEADNK